MTEDADWVAESAKYMPPHPRGRWSYGNMANGRKVYLIERTPVDDDAVVDDVLIAMGYEACYANRNRFFPLCPRRKRRCPTLELIWHFRAVHEKQRTPEYQAGV